jgi:hypothetical protein
MIRVHWIGGKKVDTQYDDFLLIRETVNRNRAALSEQNLAEIIERLAEMGRSIAKDSTLMSVEGVPYITIWLRNNNLRAICRANQIDPEEKRKFLPIGEKRWICLQPRGVVCHWVANNIPTLSILTLTLAILAKNGSIVKVPEENANLVVGILSKLRGKLGKDIQKAIAIVSFDSKDSHVNCLFSQTADCKLIWGGSEAVRSIISLPQKDHCETIIFGPKYSFSVFDREYLESEIFQEGIRALASDIFQFNQSACTSPHVIFIEKSRITRDVFADILSKELDMLRAKFGATTISESTAARVINKRWEYYLEPNGRMLTSEDISWTILYGDSVSLEEPVYGRCVYLKEVNEIEEILPLVTRNVQTIGTAILNEERFLKFSGEATYLGADRCIIPGRVHEFDSPWDGMLPLQRLVRWTIAKMR